MTVYILGGGPAGLAVADGLSEADAESCVLVECSAHLGGLARTVEWKPHGFHDLGPHKIFTRDQHLLHRVMALLPRQDWLTCEKTSSIYMGGHFLSYPPSPFSLPKVFGMRAFIRMVTGYARAVLVKPFRTGEPVTFEQDLCRRLGAPLYEALFAPIARKLWGDPSRLDARLAQGRVQTPSLLELMKGVFGSKRADGFEALYFNYPKGGLSTLWQAIAARTRKGDILLNHEVTSLTVVDGRVTRLVARDRGRGHERIMDIGRDDYVVSTLPIGLCAQLLEGDVDASLGTRVRETVALNDLYLVFFRIDRPKLMRESWVFTPDPDVVFHRVSEQSSFDPDMTPGGSIVCCEVMANELRDTSTWDDARLGERCRIDLDRLGFEPYEILDQRVIRLPNSYPVFRVGYERQLASVLASFDRLENFRTIGRQGAFNYIGTLDAMDIGYGWVRWRMSGGGHSWADERTRTSHYPVLD